MKKAVRTKKVPLKKIKIIFDCPECGGEGYVEVPYCPSPIAVEPAWKKEECGYCYGNGVAVITLEHLLRIAFPDARFGDKVFYKMKFPESNENKPKLY